MRVAPLLLLLFLLSSLAEAQLVANVDDYGRLTEIRMSDSLVAQNLHVEIIKPRWEGSWLRQGEGAQSGQTAVENGVRVYRSVYDTPMGVVRLEQRLQATPQEIHIQWRLTPEQDITTESVYVFVELPVAGNAGQGSFVANTEDVVTIKPLPAELSTPYHIFSGEISWCAWALPQGVGLQFIPDGQGLRKNVNFQDNRQFKAEVFQAQFSVEGTAVWLKAGRTYQFALTVKPFDTAAFARAKQQAQELEQAWEIPMKSDKPLKFRGMHLSAPRVPQYEKLEITLDLDATYDNPFNPAEVEIVAHFRGPGGKEVAVPAFYYQDFERLGPKSGRYLRPTGTPQWKVRFAPPTPGAWTVRITARDRNGQLQSPPTRFVCTPSSQPGYIRRSPNTPYYLQFDNGQPYFPIGLNVCWGSLQNYQEWFAALGAAGGNYARIWLVRWNMGLEWLPGKGTGTYYGLGKYSLDNAYRLDIVLQLARQNGIYVMLCLGYHGELMDTRAYFGEDCWGENPYNQANGGPCARPADFWTNEEARRFYKQRLRYILARYAWDTHILSWELWNEVHAPAPWVQEMAGYIKANDFAGHLVTTTYGNKDVWTLPEMDYTQEHSYGADEGRPRLAEAIINVSRAYTLAYPKPFQIGEFGIDFKTSDATHDPQGLGTGFHDGLWASIMSRGMGTAAIWYWDNYVHRFNLYREFTSIKRFVAGIPWHKWQPQLLEFGAPVLPPDPQRPWGDIVLMPALGWARQPEGELTVNHDGTVGGAGAYARFLFAPSKPDLYSPLRLRVHYPHEGKLTIHINQVSNGAVLQAKIDGQLAWTQELPCGPGEGPWKRAFFSPQWQIWQNYYDQDFEISIPAGEHLVELTNEGKDWAEITQIKFIGLRDPRFALLDQCGLYDDQRALIWLHDQESNWYNDKYGRLPAPLRGVQTSLRGLKDGRWRVQWWDTRAGRPLAETQAVCRQGVLPLRVPDFTRDIAARLERLP